jgi:hypothetical protein
MFVYRKKGETRFIYFFKYSLINIFAKRESLPIVKNLCLYKESLEELSLRDSDLIRNKKLVPVTTQFIICDLITKGFACVANLPFSLPILVTHIPLYLIGSYYGKREWYEEVRAQDKILYCTLALPFVYFFMFLWIWYYLYCFRYFGFFYAIITLVILMWLHVVTIDDSYENFKQLRGTVQLFDSFVLGRGTWKRKERILFLLKLRETIEKELDQLLLESEEDLNVVRSAIRKRSK